MNYIRLRHLGLLRLIVVAFAFVALAATVTVAQQITGTQVT